MLERVCISYYTESVWNYKNIEAMIPSRIILSGFSLVVNKYTDMKKKAII